MGFSPVSRMKKENPAVLTAYDGATRKPLKRL
jgi:hypothetical protein